MSAEIPSDLIRRIQTTLRKNAGIPPFYDPSSLPPLPSLRDSISALDAGADPFSSDPRCGRCRRGAGLVRGELSTLCIFCGHDRRKDGLTHSVSFCSTAACRKLLESLKLDGSEVINFTESDGSNKGQGTKDDDLVLSSLLDFELKWPPEKEKDVNRRSDNALVSVQAVNFSGVDLDTFFSDSKNMTTSSTLSLTSEELMPKKQIISTETHVSSGSENFGFFNNLQTPDLAVSSDNNKGGGDFGDPFADWEAGFQSASSEVFHAESESKSAEPACSTADVGVALESKSIDIFEGSITEVSNHVTAASTCKEYKNMEHEMRNSGRNGEPKSEWGDISSSGNWIRVDLWPDTADQLESRSETNTSALKDDVQCMTSTSDSWGQDELGATSSMKALNIKSKHHDDDDDIFGDPLDSWQDFASSNEVAGVSSSSWAQSDCDTLDEHISTSKSVDLQNMEFGNFLQTDSFSGVLGEPRCPNETEAITSNHVDGDDVFDDSLDSWQEFSTSNEVPGVSSSSWAEPGNEITSNGHTSTLKSVDLQDMEFGDFLQTNSSSETLGEQRAPNETKDVTSKYVDDDDDVLDDPLDSWQDFASSNEVHGVSSSSCAQSSKEITSNDHASTLKSVDQDTEFSNFLQPDSFSGTLGEQRGSTEIYDTQLSASASTNDKEKYSNIKSINGKFSEPWQDATNPIVLSGDFSNIWTQATMEPTSNEHALGTESMDPQDIKFGSFLHSDPFSGPLSGEKELTEANDTKLDGPVSTNSTNEFNQSGDNDDSWDDWQDFTSSNEAPGNLPNSLTFSAKSISTKHALGVKSVDVQNPESGSFIYSDLFPVVDGQRGLNNMNSIQLESLISKPNTEFISSNHTNDGYDLLESWKVFSSLNKVPDGLSNDTNLPKQTDTEVTSYVHASGIKSVDLKDVEFGSFLQSDMFSGMSRREDSSNMNDVQIDDFVFTSSVTELNNTKNKDDIKDPFEAWLDFTSSNLAQGSSANLSTEPDNRVIYEHASGTMPLDLQDMDFGSFLHSNSFTGALSVEKASSEPNNVQNSSVLYRMNGIDEKIGMHSVILESAGSYENNSDASNLDGSNSKVEMLLSRMPDLSFMLEDHLSIPKKADSPDLKS